MRDPNPFPCENRSKELFPTKAEDIGDEFRRQSRLIVGKELFPNKLAANNIKKELFPLKTGTPVHRRSDAFDASDETADMFASRMRVPFIDGAPDEDIARLELASKSTHKGFNIRGASQQSPGFSIRGSATQFHVVAKELFPQKVGNTGKELFTEKLQGRGGKRNKAEDMFY
jgi:hypothetical protein